MGPSNNEKIYNGDKKGGSVVNTLANGKTTTPISDKQPENNQNNINEEAYREIDDKNFRPEFSNLKNTYMVSTNGHYARERFWGKQYSTDFSYRNNNADIDDPIFTGFTLSIDKLNSPLFYTIGEYDGVVNSRKSQYGEGDDINEWKPLSRNIASQIESCLIKNYGGMIQASLNSYDIVAALVKDYFPNGHEIGYGMQHNVYLDGLPYGATEYIYMVDKYLANESTYQDDALKNGHMSLGNGDATTPNVENTEDRRRKLDTDESLAKSERTRIENGLKDNDIVKEHNDYVKKKNEAEKKLNEATKPKDSKYKNRIEEIEYQIKILKNAGCSENKTYLDNLIRSKMQANITKILNEIYNLKSPDSKETKHSVNQYQNIVNRIDSLDSQLTDVINEYNNNLPNAQKLLGKSEDIMKVTVCKVSCGPEDTANASIYKNLNTEEGSVFDGSLAYKKASKYKTINIEINIENGKGAENEIQKLKEELENLEKQTSQLNREYEDYKSKSQNDKYSQYEREKELNDSILESIDKEKETLGDIDRSVDINLPGSDATIGTGQQHNTITDDTNRQNPSAKKLPDAPQTVYDILGFIRGMTRLTTEYPYLMQSVSGLDEAYKNNYFVKDSFRGSIDNKISISIYESLDLKISGMFNKYFNAAYDAQYRRERLPVNLRRFNCSIFVHDIRNFFKMSTALGGKLNELSKKNLAKIIEISLNSLSAIEFKFYGCEIVAEETGSIFDNVSNAERGDMRMTNFVFTYSDCVINYLPFEDIKHSLITKVGHKPSVNAKVKGGKTTDSLKFKNSGYLYNVNNEAFDGKKEGLDINTVDENVYNKNKSKVQSSNETHYKTAPIQKNIKDIKRDGYLDSSIGDNVYKSNSPTNRGLYIKDYDNIASISGIKGISNNGKVSSIGNVNDNDNIESVPNLLDNGTLSKVSQTASLKDIYYEDGYLGNVDDNDKFEGTPSLLDNGTLYNTSRTPSLKGIKSYSNRGIVTNLSNVNINDHDEDLNRRMNATTKEKYREHLDKEKNEFTNAVAMSSASENYEVQKQEVDRLFTHISSSIAASLGVPASNVYDAYLSEMHHIVFDGFDTPVVRNVNYLHSNNSTNSIIDIDTPNLDGIDSTSNENIVSNIGNVNNNDDIEELPNVNYQTPNIRGTNTETSNGYISRLGDVIDDDVIHHNINYIGDVIPDDITNNFVEDLDNVYPKEREVKPIKDIGDVIPDDESKPFVKNLNNIYPLETNGNIVENIDDVIPDDVRKDNVKNIDNIYKQERNGKIIRYIDDVIPDDKLNKMVKSLDKLYSKISDGEDIKDLGKV